MEYGLTRRVLTCRHFIPITEEQFAEIRGAKDSLGRILAIEERLELVLQNYVEFEHEILQVTLEKAIAMLSGWSEGRAIVLRINRRLANLLTTCRLYLDHVPRLAAPLIKSSPELIVQLTAREYESRLGYRAMEALRNYAQHRGLPLHTVRLGGRWVDVEGGRRREHTTPLYVQLDTLGSDGKFKVAVLKELEAQGQQISIKPLVREYVTGIMCVQAGLREAISDVIESSEQLLESAMGKYHEVEDTIIGLAAVQREDQVEKDYVDIFPDFLDRRRELARRNRGAGDLTTLVVSSE
jgi:hypothetical protein